MLLGDSVDHDYFRREGIAGACIGLAPSHRHLDRTFGRDPPPISCIEITRQSDGPSELERVPKSQNRYGIPESAEL